MCWEVTRDKIGRHRGNWCWNGEVKRKVEYKIVAYKELEEIKDEDDKRTNMKNIRRRRRRRS